MGIGVFIMNITERKNRDGTISYQMRCSIKAANGFKSRVKTVKPPSNITGKKAIKEWLHKEQLAWKDELSHRGSNYIVPHTDILFIDFAKQYNEQLLAYNPTGYAHYNANEAHIKTMTPKLGKYLLTEMTPPVIQSFCLWLMERRFDKYVITAKPALSILIGERHITLQSIADGCKIANTTLFSVLHGENISMATATKVCDYLQIPLKQYFTVKKESKPYSYSANNGVKVFIHGVLHEAVRQGLIERNYASKDYIRPVTGTKGTKLILKNADEYKQFIERMNAEPDLRKKAAFACYIYLGLRNAEVAGLAWKNIDLEKNEIAIVQNTIYAGKKFGTVTKTCKTENANRLIGIPTALAEILKEYRAWWLQEQERLGDLWANTDKLFVTNTGKDMCGSTLANWLKAFEIKHSLKRVTPHGYRHSSITLQIANGIDVKTVSARAGHADIQTTLNIYSHYTKEADRQAAETIDRLLKV